jgi:tetratricopeptide (TPR) repeat protein
LAQSSITLPEILHDNGFTASAIVSAFVLDSRFGLDQGFDDYDDEFQNVHKNVAGDERLGDETTRCAQDWIEKNKDKKSFLFLHFYDPHSPYEPPEPFNSKFADNLYAGEIAFTDHCIGQVIEKLKELDIYDSSLIIIAGDHGEMLGEHGEEEHTFFVYESAVKVPLIIKLPGRSESKKEDRLVGLIDVFPTICGVLGIEVPSHVQGRDLSVYFGHKPPAADDRHLFCESLTPTSYLANSLLAVVTGKWKYIQTTRPELYDLDADPGELDNLAEKQPHRVRIMQDKLKQILEQTIRQDDSESSSEMDQKALDRLASLGYVAGNAMNEEFTFDQSRNDPKDTVSLYVAYQNAHMLSYKGKYSKARSIFRKLLLEYPDFTQLHSQIAFTSLKLKDYDTAAGHLRICIELNPNDSSSRSGLGTILALQGKNDQAEIHLTEALRINPNIPEAHYRLGSILDGRGELDRAAVHFRKLLAINPSDTRVCNMLASISMRQSKFNQTIAYFRKSLQINPDQPGALNDLAWIRATHIDPEYRNVDEALQLARRVCELTNFQQPSALDTLAAAYANAGRFPQAIETADRAIKIAGSTGNEALVKEIQNHLTLYRDNKPYRESMESE